MSVAVPEPCMHNACMKNVQVRNVPERVHRVLRRRAEEAGQSLQEYLLQLLETEAGRPTMKEFLDRVSKRAGGTFTTDEVVRAIREDRESH